MEPTAVQLSYCLPLLVYCIGALRLTSSAVRQLSVCWKDAFRKNISPQEILIRKKSSSRIWYS